MKKIIYSFYAILLTVTFSVISIRAASGDLDLTFYNHTDPTIPVTTCWDCKGEAIAVQTDGKILVAGYVQAQSFPHFYVARFDSDGAPDTTFDGDGMTFTVFGNSSSLAYAIAVQPDGKILVAGYVASGIAVARYNTDGSLDTSFDGDGRVVTSYSGSYADSIAVQTDGKIVVGGAAGGNFAAARYNADGSPDASFNAGGLVFVDIDNGSHEQARSIIVQDDGKIVLAGYVYHNNRNDFAVVRLTGSGALDSTFDGDGKVTTSVLYANDVHAAAIQPDGKIVVAGNARVNSNYAFALVRYNGDGSLDSGFDGDGIIVTSLSTGYDLARSVKVQTDGKIIVGGKKGSNDYAIARYRSNGALDPFWGSGGIVSTNSGNTGGIDDIAIQPDGKIVSVGILSTAVYSSLFRFENSVGTDPNEPCVKPASGLISWWRGEVNTNDYIGGNHGTLENGASYGAGEVGQAFKLDGVNDAVFIGNPGSLDVTSITVEAWINPQDVPVWSLSNVVAKWGYDASLDSYLLGIVNYGGTITAFGAIGDGSTGDPGFSGGTIPLDRWTHIAMTHDRPNAINRLYVNGVLVAERTRKGGVYQTSTDVYIGGEDSSNNRFFNGSIDEPSIYDRALEPYEIQRIFDAGYSGKCF